MTKRRLNLRKVIAIAICLAGSATMLAQSNTTDNDPKGVIKIESWSARKDREIGLSNVKELLFEGGKMWANGYKLNNRQAQKVMSVNTEAFRLYKKGKKQNAGGNALLCTGVPIFAAGTFVAIVFAAESKIGAGMGLGIGAATAGLGLTGGGIALKIIGKKSLQKSVDMFNSSNKMSQVDIRMGLTGNGLGLVVNL